MCCVRKTQKVWRNVVCVSWPVCDQHLWNISFPCAGCDVTSTTNMLCTLYNSSSWNWLLTHCSPPYLIPDALFVSSAQRRFPWCRKCPVCQKCQVCQKCPVCPTCPQCPKLPLCKERQNKSAITTQAPNTQHKGCWAECGIWVEMTICFWSSRSHCA